MRTMERFVDVLDAAALGFSLPQRGFCELLYIARVDFPTNCCEIACKWGRTRCTLQTMRAHTRNTRNWKVWTHNGIRIHYLPELDGTGRSLVAPYMRFLRTNIFDRPRFDKAFEWCSGPGFIGFSLLAEGLCKRLCVADINPQAVEALRRTVRENGLEDVVTVYLSDNFESIPATESFDLVVGNPPWYYHDNPTHQVFGSTWLARTLHRGRLCAIDDGWKIHEAFYSRVADYLNPGAVVCPYVQAPFESELWFAPRWGRATRVEPKPYNVRPRPPFETFTEMIAKSGLTYMATVSDKPYRDPLSLLTPFPGMWIMVSRMPADDLRTAKSHSVWRDPR